MSPTAASPRSGRRPSTATGATSSAPAAPPAPPVPRARVRVPDPDLGQPRLPDPLFVASTDGGTLDNGAYAAPRPSPPPVRALRGGCYLVRFTPAQPAGALTSIHYDGSLRVERAGSTVIASGDLYLHQLKLWPGDTRLGAVGLSEPDPSAGVPIFSIGQYRYYMRVIRLAEVAGVRNRAPGLTLDFELHRFTVGTKSWSREATCSAQLGWATAPSGYPTGADYLTGNVVNDANATMGTFELGWVSRYLRRAVVEIDRVADAEPPLHNGTGIDWRSIFETVGWDVTVE